MGERRVQCKACPWKVGVDPERDIPGGYSVERHEALDKTIADGTIANVFRPGIHTMACHESAPGAEQACVGWVVNQLGPGNNIALRLRARDGRYDGYRTVGPQHERFEDTLPRRKRRRAS